MSDTGELLIKVFRFLKYKSGSYYKHNKMEDFVCLQQ